MANFRPVRISGPYGNEVGVQFRTPLGSLELPPVLILIGSQSLHFSRTPKIFAFSSHYPISHELLAISSREVFMFKPRVLSCSLRSFTTLRTTVVEWRGCQYPSREPFRICIVILPLSPVILCSKNSLWWSSNRVSALSHPIVILPIPTLLMMRPRVT